jgi:hypothetical protein
LKEYEDGWALCVNAREVQGMVPLMCLKKDGARGGGVVGGTGGGDVFRIGVRESPQKGDSGVMARRRHSTM